MGIFDKELQPHLQRVVKDLQTHKEKWLFVLQNNRIQENNFLKNAKRCKSERQIAAVKFREQGNAYMTKHEFLLACYLYTESIALAIEGPLASLAYCNRSATLFQMKYYDDCIKDIDRALQAGYPKPQLIYRLHLRKARCLKFLNKDYDNCLSDAMKAIEECVADKFTKSRLSVLVLCKIEAPEPSCKMEVPNPSIGKMPELSYGFNPEVPSFSNAVSIARSREFGRHLAANRDISTGDVLIVEDTVVSSACLFVHREVCNFCFKYCLSLIPCTECGFTMYCNKKCRDDDWKNFHRGNCLKKLQHEFLNSEPNIAGVIKSPEAGPAHAFTCFTLMLRLINFVGIENIRKTIYENKPTASSTADPTSEEYLIAKYKKVTLDALLSLEDNFGKLNDTSLEIFTFNSFSLCVEYNIPHSEWFLFAAIFMKLCMVVEFNRQIITCPKFNYKTELSMPNLQLGMGLYLASSLVNHSCEPNMYQVFYGTSVVFRAKRPIGKGEQLTCCYMEPALPAVLFDRQQRQKVLMDIHKFQCRCLACVDDYRLLCCRAISPMANRTKHWFEDAAIVAPKIAVMLQNMYYYNYPATKQMLPKMLALLKYCHDFHQTSSRWYFYLQEIVQNHYKAEGTCLFFNGSKQILFGDQEEYFSDVLSQTLDKLKEITL